MTALPSVGARHAPGLREESDASVIGRSREDPDAFAALFDRYADDIQTTSTATSPGGSAPRRPTT